MPAREKCDSRPQPARARAYSDEVSSAGFLAGRSRSRISGLFFYAYPVPEGFADTKVSQPKASFSCGFGEFIPPYDAMRTAPDPGSVLLKFLQSAYEAAASLGRWDRKALGREQGECGKPPFGKPRS